MLNYMQVQPHSLLRKYISYYWYMNSNITHPLLFTRIIPFGINYILFNLGDPIISHPEQPLPTFNVDTAYFVGVMTKPLLVGVRDKIENLGVMFKPGYGQVFFREPMMHYTNSIISLQDIWDKNLKVIEDALRQRKSLDQRFNILNKIFIEYMNGSCREDVIVEKMVDYIVKKDGLMKMKELEYLSGISMRQIQRKFLNYIGLSPKVFARIARFQKAFDLLPDANQLSDIAHDAGYFDQAHFIKEFKAHSGILPSEYVNDACKYGFNIQ